MQQRFRALWLERDAAGATRVRLARPGVDALPRDGALIGVEWSSLNYKDALAITGRAPVVARWPMVPGIDLAGRVLDPGDSAFSPGDRVVLTGRGLGERRWGGLAERARVPADGLLPLPAGMDARDAMTVGTAGVTAMLCVMAIESAGVRAGDGEVLVTGATGGVGSMAVMLLHAAGYRVVAATGRAVHADWLRALGADEILPRAALARSPRPLERQRWAGVVDTVGGIPLAHALAALRYGGVAAACGLAADAALPTTVMPFILRGVTLCGVDSVQCPEARLREAWSRIAALLPASRLTAVRREAPLEAVPGLARELLAGRLRGRVVVDVGR